MNRNYKFYIPLFDRGFTGHVKQPFGLRISANQLRMLIPQRNECGKMLDVFGLINMLSNAKSRSEALAGNGRMYDPVLGRMLSPDNYVSLPEHTQGYNRYTYALNNPLIITDPSGDNPVLLFIAFAGVLNGAMSAQNGDGFLQGFAIGTATAALGYGVGAIIGPVMAGPGAIPGMVNAGVNTAISGGITYGFDALINNSSFNWKGWATNVGMNMVLGGIEGYADANNYNNLMGPRPYGEPMNINNFSGKPVGYKRTINSLFNWDKYDILEWDGVINNGQAKILCKAKSLQNLFGNTEEYWNTYIENAIENFPNVGGKENSIIEQLRADGFIVSRRLLEPYGDITVTQKALTFNELKELHSQGGVALIEYENYSGVGHSTALKKAYYAPNKPLKVKIIDPYLGNTRMIYNVNNGDAGFGEGLSIFKIIR